MHDFIKCNLKKRLTVLSKFTDRVWYHQNKFAYVLWPFACLYRFILFIRASLYWLGFLRTTHFPIPVIVVGNITVGGTGKTPLVIELAKQLKTQGFRPGIVSRGYAGRARHYPLRVHSNTPVSEAGDEALMIAKRELCPVIVAPKRVEAIRYLIEETDCNLVISDDGLQHHSMGRAIEIVVLDGARGLGNGLCLPAGPLRESATRLLSVDALVINGESESSGRQHRHRFSMNIVPIRWVNVLDPKTTLPLEAFSDQCVHAVVAIGHPERFFKTLKNLVREIHPHVFPDHAFFEPNDLSFDDTQSIVMTEKDAVKCMHFQNPHLWYLQVEAELPEAWHKWISNASSKE